MTDNRDWQLISHSCDLLGRPDHPFSRALALAPKRRRLLAIALRSGEIPMRGRRVTALGLETPERIEAKIDVATLLGSP
jgi:hypothetical protein